MKWIGAHVSAEGGVHQAPLNASAIGARAFALFVKNQRQWQAKPLEPAVREAFAANLAAGGFTAAQVLPHAGYLINLANPDPGAHVRSTDSFINEMRRCADLGLDRLNLHPGSHLRQCSVNEAVGNVARAANRVRIDDLDGEPAGKVAARLLNYIAQRQPAGDRDQEVIEQRKAEAERAAALAAPSETVLDDVIEIDTDSGLVDTYESREG